MMRSATPELFDNDGYERIALADADLRLWRRIDVGRPDAEMMQILVDETDWRQEWITVYGKRYRQPRLSAWYGDRGYRYSGLSLEPRRCSETLQSLRQRVEHVTGLRFNSVLLNYYRDQSDSMGLHSDDERELGPRPAIASLSLGEERVFQLKHRRRKDLATCRINLPSGSLLLMQGETQHNWRHGIARQKRPCGPRLNLTFRWIRSDRHGGAPA